MQCSDKRLKLGIAWREPCGAAWMGRPREKVGHTHEEKSPQEFGKLLLIPDGLDVRSIPSCFHPWLDGESRNHQPEDLHWLHLGCRPEGGRWQDYHGRGMVRFC